ncbi:peroxisome assembly factor 2 isoform X2 [Belonocnema kinseyi]|nr:peroxisome assembly factor 2 isoform X2 [Belonocnema kinseyi]
MKFNLQNALGIPDFELCSYFLFPGVSSNVVYATEATISIISNPYVYSSDFTDSLLKSYFSKPRYLRSKDVFSVDVKKYSSDCYYSSIDSEPTAIYFMVKSIKSKNLKMSYNGCYCVYKETTLIQKSHSQSYLPKTHFCDIQLISSSDNLIYSHSQCPPSLEDASNELKTCILPFLQKDISINVKPIFLVEGPQGSGKCNLIQIVAGKLGLNMVNVNCSEIQSSTSAQTELRLRKVLTNAENSSPCILTFRNIQVFGINTDGQRDDRIISHFGIELKKLYNKNLRFPVIFIATSESSDLPSDLERKFVATIRLKYLDQTQRLIILSWLLKSKGIVHQADLHKIAGLCSNFVLADLEALVLHATKMKHKQLSQRNESGPLVLLGEDLNKACEYMQSMFSNRIVAPDVPKVHWGDIGGLADLKHEIIRRIELPLLNDTGLGQSGLLLYGPPGTGKTLLAKAVATECQLNFLSVKGPELLNMYVGQSEKNVRQVFERAKAVAPCIIFFDELDSLAPNRGKNGDSGGVIDRVVSQLLSEMDGLGSSNNIFIIAATNRPDLIDPALLRPGRFDKMLYVGIYSDNDSQVCVLKALTRQFIMKREEQELRDLVKELPSNLTGADLYSVCSNAWLLAVRKCINASCTTDDGATRIESTKLLTEKVVVVTVEDFTSAARELIPSVSMDELKRYGKLSNELSMR